MVKICRICKREDLTDDDFYKNDKTNRCKSCERERKKLERKLKPRTIQDRQSWLKKNYNISLEEYDELLLNQNGKCAICGGEGLIKKGNLCIDHCHITNKVRGLLCHSCNTGLGQFRDNIDLLNNAIKYLKENG